MSSDPLADIVKDNELLNELRGDALNYAAAKGVSMIKHGAFVHAPCTLLPTYISRQSYEQALSLATGFNQLYEAISRDHKWLIEQLTSTSLADPFMASLLSILRDVEQNEETQPWRLSINRSDYMMHVDHSNKQSDKPSIKPLQVEFNTISCSFASLSTRVAAMHRYSAARLMGESITDQLPINQPVEKLAKAIALAFNHYKDTHADTINQTIKRSVNQPSLSVLMIVQSNELNIIDQKMLEYELFEQHKVPVIRRTLSEVDQQATLGPNKELIINHTTIAVSYFRAAYTPDDFKSTNDWDALSKIERSLSIKCPSVAQHLSGTKKVQQVLCLPGMVERFVDNETAAHLRTSFAGLWAIDASEADAESHIEQAIKEPSKYVLKPQREGGGNNLWGDEMVSMLKTMSREARSAYILMQRIEPASLTAVLMRSGVYSVAAAHSELGIYATMLSDGKQVKLNECAGHLLRTKEVGVNEGGVAAGYACLDSPLLI